MTAVSEEKLNGLTFLIIEQINFSTQGSTNTRDIHKIVRTIPLYDYNQFYPIHPS